MKRSASARSLSAEWSLVSRLTWPRSIAAASATVNCSLSWHRFNTCSPIGSSSASLLAMRKEHRGRDSFVAKPEQFIVRCPAGEVERRDGLNHYEPLFCSMCSDMVGEVPQRRECLAYLAIVGLQLEAVGP